MRFASAACNNRWRRAFALPFTPVPAPGAVVFDQ
jgi:hypothetical protein